MLCTNKLIKLKTKFYFMNSMIWYTGGNMAFIKRFSDIRRGDIVFTGNTLGLSKLTNANSAGTLGSIGAFITLDLSQQVNDFPFGTTLNYALNSSSAELSLPAGSTVLYTELVWGGLFRSTVNNISGVINNGVTFTTPVGSQSVLPDPITAQTFNINVNNITLGFYTRSANVTSILQSSGNGTYTVGNVPALIEALDNRTDDTNHAGWTLAVVYANPALQFRSLNLWVGGEVVSPTTGTTTITLSGFQTPDEPTPNAKLFVSAQEGDAVLTGDQMLFGENGVDFTNLSGPNNPQNNFFCSQINNSNGTLDTSGTFGTRNANPVAGTNTSACRQGYDITAVDLTGKLNPLQTTAYIRFTSSGDLYVPNCLAIEIENGANPDLEVVKSVDKEVAVVGDILTYTSVVTNTGSLTLNNVTFTDNIPVGTSIVDGSVFINGVNYPTYNPQTGFNLGTLALAQSTTITFQVQVN